MSALPARVLVVGLARSGEAAALALARRGVHVIGADRSEQLDAGRLRTAGVEVHLGTEEGELLDAVDLVVKSPGVPASAPLVAAASLRDLPIWSEIELGYRLLPGRRFVGITGTNGKTTTCELLGAIFRESGRVVAVAGNVGRPLTALADTDLPEDAWIVCELSSFQLEDVHAFHAHVAVLLNLEPDHLDRHESFDAYRAAKLRLFERQERDDTAVLPRGFGPVPGVAARVEFGGADPLPAEPHIPGAHNRENAAAATAVARAAGIEDAAIARALEQFPGVPHRLEPVADVDGVLYVNDSKATNTAAARWGIAAYDAPLHLILGGSLKGESFDELAASIPATVRGVYLIGEAADQLAAALDRAGVGYVRAGDLATAFQTASRNARAGEIVLLSPACASYDQFDNFEQRGDAFRRLAQELLR